jgi:hypothetical protein
MKYLLPTILMVSSLILAPVGVQAQLTPALLQAGDGMSAEKLTEGFKSAFDTIITQALHDTELDVSAPSALTKIMQALNKTGKGDLTSGFTTALAEATAKISPELAGLIQSELTGAKVADAKSLLMSGSTAGTQYLMKVTAPKLREKLLPLVKQATAAAGVGDKARAMIAAAGPLAGLAGGKAIIDLDSYVTDQLIDQSFSLIAAQELAVRAKPSLLKDNELAQKLFTMFRK